MTAIDHPSGGEVQDILRRLRALETQSPLESSSVSNGRVRFRGGLLRVDTGGRVEIVGTLDVAGTTAFTGNTDITGDLDITGPTQIDGPTTIFGQFWVNGYTRINASAEINGALALNNDLTVNTGRIIAGPVLIDRAGSYGGRVYSSSILVLDAGSGILMDTNVDIRGILLTDGLDVDGPKNFRISHPTKPGFWLRHGSTESPVSGTEYTGRLTLDAVGEGVIELPPYFEALNKPEGRTTHLTPVGRPFPVGADDVADGQVTVYGDPGREVFWLVKAERIGADFLLEEEIPPEKTDDGRVGPWAPA